MGKNVDALNRLVGNLSDEVRLLSDQCGRVRNDLSHHIMTYHPPKPKAPVPLRVRFGRWLLGD